MTNEERKEMYQDWENLLGTHLYSADHDERVGMLESLLKGIGRRLDYDMTSLLLLINEYDKEACEPEYTPKVGDICRVIEARIDGEYTYFWKGDIVKIINVQNSLCFVQSLMPTQAGDGCWTIKCNSLEEV